MIALAESISRQALIHLANQYESVADALMELVDNPFDYRYGRHLSVAITVDKRLDSIAVLDQGGEGMDGGGLCDWIQWGTGHAHLADDIGQYHVGGKLAAIYLAGSLEVWSRRAGSATTWRFVDSTWGTRTSLYAGSPDEIQPAELAGLDPDLGQLPARVGFTKILMTRLKPHRYESAILRGRLGNVYRALLRDGEATLSVDGETVMPVDIPLSSIYQPAEIPRIRVAPGAFIRGRLWVTDRERFNPGRGVGLKAGVRTVYNGRLITQGEEFGHYLAGRGSLQRLVGEIEIVGLRPNSTKTGWDTDSPEWQAISERMHAVMQPLVGFLNQLSESHPVSREQRKRVQKVRRDLESAFRNLAERLRGPESDARFPGGRLPPVPKGKLRLVGNGLSRGPVENRTAPPPNAVGRLLRRYQAEGFPRIEFDDLGANPRTQWRDDRAAIVINTAYPLYDELRETDGYLADCVVSHLVGAEGGETDERELRIDELLWEWHRVATA